VNPESARAIAYAENAVEFRVARTVDDLIQAIAIRSLVYVGEQDCPFEEEVDGNDISGATHILARVGAEPIGTLRIRWFAEFAKIEHAAIRAEYRRGGLGPRLWWAGGELAARKGYKYVLGYVEPGLLDYWSETLGAVAREGRPPFVVSGRTYVEVVVDVGSRITDPLGFHSPPHVLLRPEGTWDNPGILDQAPCDRSLNEPVEASV
jgi:Acetyltransferase (GNAT) family